MVARFARSGMTVAPDVPVRKRKAFDRGRAPHLRPFRDGLRCLFLMLALAWELRVRRSGRAGGSQ